MREVEVVLDTGSVLRVVAYEAEIMGEGLDAVARTEYRAREWFLDGEPIPEWAGETLVQMMTATGRFPGG